MVKVITNLQIRSMIKNKNEFTQFDSKNNELVCQGDWTLANLKELKTEFKNIRWPAKGTITINGNAINKMDSAGAWLLSRQFKNLDDQHCKADLTDFSEQHQKLLNLIEEQDAANAPMPARKIPGWLADIGKYAVQQVAELRDFLSFTGKLSIETLRLIRHPKHFRWAALVNVLDTTGFRALPIIALLSFMIGVVMAYQMGTQLRSYGANLFIVDFLGLSILREFGPLLTAIMVAGRTGSAFTAQLGTMKINQEIDALNTMGVTPGELLLLPRIIGLVIALPLLTIWADIFGTLGGMIMAHNMLGILPHDFLQRFAHVIPLRTLLIGLGKAPVFALLISAIGCFEGMRVHGSADSVGQQTTRSVVLSIFFIIVADAIFSIIFNKMQL
jgi:phospholipid/cholesterol/gamma-HCH transport system permease protein